MKKIIYTLAVVSLFFVSCDNNTDEFNNNQDLPYDVSAESLFTNAQKQLADQMTTPSVNLNPFRFLTQYWAQTTYNQESRYDFVTRAISANHWNALYRNVLGNLESAKQIINQESRPVDIPEAQWNAQQQNKIAVIEILEVYTFQILVDTFGDIPYTDALDPENKIPSYDDDETIYPKLIIRLDEAIANLNASEGSFESSDVVYNGDVEQWTLFANTLKLKLGINLSDVNSTLAQSTIQEAFTSGIIVTNAQNANFQYPASAPNYNPLYAELVASQRNDYIAADTFVAALQNLSDPRIAVYFESVDGGYVGGIYGVANNNFSSFSQIGNRFKEAGLSSQFFDASEINFYLAEAAARGYSVGGSAEFYYNAAITLSFEFYGLTATQATNYLALPSVAYATAPGDWKQKIGTQAWIALYGRPFESWTTFRRLDVPDLQAPSNASAAAEGEVPKRLAYPIPERTVNTTSYNAAATAIGGDKLQTRIFWDVN